MIYANGKDDFHFDDCIQEALTIFSGSYCKGPD
jgi:hypothetical protein